MTKKLISPVELLLLLKGSGLSELLAGAVGEVQADELVSKLIESSSQPELLVTQALSDVNPGTLEAAVGSILTGEPFTKTTVGELASSFGTTEGGLTEALGTSAEKLPEGAMALIAPLANSKTLGVLDGQEGLGLVTLAHAEEGGGSGSEGSGGGGSGGGTGGSGGVGGASAGGSGGTGPGTLSTTIVINGVAQPGSSGTPSSKLPGKMKLISRSVHGKTVRLVIQVPGAGRLTLSGRGVKRVSEQTATSERVTLKTALTRAVDASRRRHHHTHITIELKVVVTPVGSASSVVHTAARFG